MMYNTLLTDSYAMLTDLYQLTMAQGYWNLGKDKQRAVFDLFFREHPFQGGYTIFCGLAAVLEMIQSFHFKKEDVDYLASLKGANNTPLFSSDFLQMLLNLRLTVDIDALNEGSLAFPKEPLLRVEGPLLECQLLETVLLNLINFPTLIATKASRICHAAKGDQVIEFGLRRAQGPNGGLTASRAAFVGGCTSTSNVLAGKVFGIPVSGTHAHSWVMAFDTELAAFQAYSKAMPQNVILLVDTYHSLEGVKNAIQVGLDLKKQGSKLLGIRLDSGDLAALSIEARKLLDAAGLIDTQIVGSNDLDEYTILELKKRGAQITLWGVGTRLATAYEQAALGGVYKLVAIEKDPKERSEQTERTERTKQGEQSEQTKPTKTLEWIYKSKQTDDIKKKTYPGIHQVRRFFKNKQMQRDVIFDQIQGEKPTIKADETFEDLLVPVVRQGRSVIQTPSIHQVQVYAKSQLEALPDIYKKLSPYTETDPFYPVSFHVYD